MITNLPLFKHKLVVFLGNGAKLVLVKGTGRYFISGALSDYSTSLYELNRRHCGEDTTQVQVWYG